jgi:hypothetical protein
MWRRIWDGALYAFTSEDPVKVSVLLSFIYLFIFLIYVGCPGQLTRTTIIPHGPLDILQAQEQVRHRGDDRHAHRGSNPGRGRNKSHGWPQQLDPQVQFIFTFLRMCCRMVWVEKNPELWFVWKPNNLDPLFLVLK